LRFSSSRTIRKCPICILLAAGARIALETLGTDNLVGVTTVDTSHPTLAAAATVED
jgi:hypothetical protein